MKPIIFLLVVILSYTSCSDEGMEGSIIGEWKLRTMEDSCQEGDVVTYDADPNGCVQMSQVDERAGQIITIQWQTCPILVFEEDRAYWKLEQPADPHPTAFTYTIDESETMVELCSSSACYSMQSIEGTLTMLLHASSVSIFEELHDCQRTMTFIKDK